MQILTTTPNICNSRPHCTKVPTSYHLRVCSSCWIVQICIQYLILLQVSICAHHRATDTLKCHLCKIWLKTLIKMIVNEFVSPCISRYVVVFTQVPDAHVVIPYLYLGLYSLGGETSYRKSWRGEIGFALLQSFWNLTGASSAALPRCLSNLKPYVSRPRDPHGICR